MQDPAFYRKLFAYNHNVLEVYLRKLRRLPTDVSGKDRGIGHGSYLRTFAHIVRVHDAWLNYIVRGDFEGLRKGHEEFVHLKTWKEVEAYFARTWQGIDRLLAETTPKSLRRRVKAPWMPGKYTLEDAFLQTTFEQAHHLGELIGAFWQEDRIPPQMMWIPTVHRQKVSVR
jgi:uncharacterized damage-inducible protein DinB